MSQPIAPTLNVYALSQVTDFKFLYANAYAEEPTGDVVIPISAPDICDERFMDDMKQHAPDRHCFLDLSPAYHRLRLRITPALNSEITKEFFNRQMSILKTIAQGPGERLLKRLSAAEKKKLEQYEAKLVAPKWLETIRSFQG